MIAKDKLVRRLSYTKVFSFVVLYPHKQGIWCIVKLM